MDTVGIALIALSALALAYALVQWAVKGGPAKQVRDLLEKDHLEPIDVKHDLSKSTTINAHVDFTARSKSGEIVSGHAYARGGKWILNYPPGFDRLKHLKAPDNTESMNREV